jgi:hypothetical protein
LREAHPTISQAKESGRFFEKKLRKKLLLAGAAPPVSL